MCISVGNADTHWKVLVAPIRDPVILGLDFLLAINASILCKGDIRVDDQIVPNRWIYPDGSSAAQ